MADALLKDVEITIIKMRGLQGDSTFIIQLNFTQIQSALWFEDTIGVIHVYFQCNFAGNHKAGSELPEMENTAVAFRHEL